MGVRCDRLQQHAPLPYPEVLNFWSFARPQSQIAFIFSDLCNSIVVLPDPYGHIAPRWRRPLRRLRGNEPLMAARCQNAMLQQFSASTCRKPGTILMAALLPIGASSSAAGTVMCVDLLGAQGTSGGGSQMREVASSYYARIAARSFARKRDADATAAAVLQQLGIGDWLVGPSPNIPMFRAIIFVYRKQSLTSPGFYTYFGLSRAPGLCCRGHNNESPKYCGPLFLI